MKDRNKEPHVCPKCGQTYTARPATSRVDGSPICPDCGMREALESIGVGREEQDKILGIIHEKYEGEE